MTVTNVNELPTNEAPSITSTAIVDAAENQTAVLDVQSSDPDGETENGGGLTYGLSGGADQALFLINAATGVLTFNAAPDFETPADVGADNVYNVQVTVTDGGGLTGVQDIAVTVTNVNEAPSITSTAIVDAAENQTAVLDVQSSDPDGETENGGGLTYGLSGGADQALFLINAATGVLTFNAAPDFETPADVGADNVYNVQVTVTDGGGLTGVQDIAVTVTNVNEQRSAQHHQHSHRRCGGEPNGGARRAVQRPRRRNRKRRRFDVRSQRRSGSSLVLDQCGDGRADVQCGA